MREQEEELGIRFEANAFSLLSVDYLHESERRTEALMFLFAGPVLTAGEIAAIRLPENELKSCMFVTMPEAVEKLGPLLGARVSRAMAKGPGVYWEDREAE